MAALSAVCLILVPLANGASAAGPALGDYQMVGFAHGVNFTFSFRDFVLEKIIDISVPHAATELGTSAGGASRAEAAQVFPGDVIAGAAPGALSGVADGLAAAPPPFSTVAPFLPRVLPGYSVSYYPPGQSADFDTANGVTGADLPSTVGPITVDTSRIHTDARLKDATAAATSHRILIANGTTPILDVASIRTTSVGKALAGSVKHTARTEVNDLTLTITPDLIVEIGSIVSQATTSSNGSISDGEASINVSDVRVISGGQAYGATIDGKGIHVHGPVPEDVPADLDVSLGEELSQIAQGLVEAGVTIRTADAVEIAEGSSSEASIGGVVIGFSGRIPRFAVTNMVEQALAPIKAMIDTYCPAQGKLPPPAQEQEIPPPFDQIFQQLPVCVSPQLVPGAGNGFVSSISIGSVDSLSAASPAFELSPPPPPGGTTGFVPSPVLPPGGTTGGTGFVPTPTTGGTSKPVGPTQLFGLAARLPSGALVFPALGFLILAAALAMGPSLRRWRRAT